MTTALAKIRETIGVQLFVPPRATVEALLEEREEKLATLRHLHEAFKTEEYANAVKYFAKSKMRDYSHHMHEPETLFADLEGATKVLDARCWDKLLDVIDARDYMPAERFDAWHKPIAALNPKPFTKGEVMAALLSYYQDLPGFLAERVEGLFRSLSRDHKTNLPGMFRIELDGRVGFHANMILQSRYTNFNDYFGCVTDHSVKVLQDLRHIVSLFYDLGRPRSILTLFGYAPRGEWVEVDGGAMEWKIHRHTVHVRVHPDIARKLNAILAIRHPTALAPERHEPSSKSKSKATRRWPALDIPLPYEVRSELESMLDSRRKGHSSVWSLPSESSKRSATRRRTIEVLESIGGVVDRHGVVSFDYDAKEVLRTLVVRGTVPDRYAHQYYPTPEHIAMRTVELAEVGPDHTCLEPSAGQGHIAKFLPKYRTRCYELSELHCEVLRAKGYTVYRADFLELSVVADVDRVVMNPPFADGRWQLHVEHAAAMLRPGGVLVSVVPTSARSKLAMGPEYTVTWHDTFARAFAGASIDVVLVRVVRIA